MELRFEKLHRRLTSLMPAQKTRRIPGFKGAKLYKTVTSRPHPDDLTINSRA
jgi:hypothetical protein